MRLLLGSSTITAIVERELGRLGGLITDATPDAVAPLDWLRPHFADDEGDLRWVIQCFVVEVDDLVVVVDTCVGDDKTIPFPRSWGGAETGWLDRFRAAGFDPDDVDVVLCTHLHVDHVGWNTRRGPRGEWIPTFPNARHLFERNEFAHWEAELGHADPTAGDGPVDLDATQAFVQLESVRPIVAAGLAELVDADHRVSAALSLHPSPGHTPGHVCVSIESDGLRAVITGDSFHHPCQIARPEWGATADVDGAAAAATRRALLEEWTDRDVVVIGTHFRPPTFGLVVDDGGERRFAAGARPDDEWAEYAGDWDDDEGARRYAELAHAHLVEVLDDRGPRLDAAVICDFGCGTGLLTERLVDAAARVDAVDASPAMLQVLREKVADRGWATVSVADELPDGEATHDLVVCSSVLSFVDDPGETVARLARLLRPGGALVHWDWERTDADGHGLTRDAIRAALVAAGLVETVVEPAFRFRIEGEAVWPLVGAGWRPG